MHQHATAHRRRVDEAAERWNEERDKNEPLVMRALRQRLDAAAVQVFDPWFLDGNTADQLPASPNEQNDGMARAHNNHLHITVKEEWIL